MNDFLDGLFTECEAKNFPAPVHLQGRRWEQGDKSMELAVPAVRELAQNLIDRFDRHGHLREAGWTTVCHEGEYKRLCTDLCLERFLQAANYQPQEATA